MTGFCADGMRLYLSISEEARPPTTDFAERRLSQIAVIFRLCTHVRLCAVCGGREIPRKAFHSELSTHHAITLQEE